MKRYRVYEKPSFPVKVLIETDDKEKAVEVMNNAHIERPWNWHELHEYWDGMYNGIRQYEPYDKIRR